MEKQNNTHPAIFSLFRVMPIESKRKPQTHTEKRKTTTKNVAHSFMFFHLTSKRGAGGFAFALQHWDIDLSLRFVTTATAPVTEKGGANRVKLWNNSLLASSYRRHISLSSRSGIYPRAKVPEKSKCARGGFCQPGRHFLIEFCREVFREMYFFL